jgi:hypothetical protein
VLASIRQVVASSALTRYRLVSRDEDTAAVDARLRDVVAERVLALAGSFGVTLPADARTRLAAWLEAPSGGEAEAAGHVATAIAGFLTSEESFVTLPAEQASAVGTALAALGPAPAGDVQAAAIAGVLGVPADDGGVKDLLVVVDQPLTDAWREAEATGRAASLLAALGATVPETPAGARFVAAVAAKLQDLGGPTAMVASDAPDAATLSWTVSGMPVLYQGLAHSVAANQLRSLGFSLVLVYLLMAVYYRSASSGLLAATPMALTLALVYGGMGALGVHLDIGTSMLASLVIGAGVDYAVHLLATWQAADDEPVVAAAERAVRANSHGIWTNALTVSVGFFVLTLGDARPLKNVGGLTSTAMIVAAVATFVVVPLLANKRRYRSQPELASASRRAA